MTVRDHYKVLGIPRNSSEDDIKKAYRSLAKQYHPDKNKEQGAEEKFKEISQAYEVLKNSDTRRVYDQQKYGDEQKAKQTAQRRTSGGAATSQTRTSFNNAGTHRFFFATPTGGGFTFTSGFPRFKFFFDSDDDDMPPRSATQRSGRSQKSTPRPFQSPESTDPRDDPMRARPWQHRFSDTPGRPMHDSSDDERSRPHDPFHQSGQDPFQDMQDVFNQLFLDPFFAQAAGGKNFMMMKKKKEKRDPVADMYDWARPMFVNKPKSPGARPSYDYDYAYDSDEDISKYLFPCSYCGKKFHSADLYQHEEMCSRFFNGRRRDTQPSAGPSKKQNKKKSDFISDDDWDSSPSPPSRQSYDWRREQENQPRTTRSKSKTELAKEWADKNVPKPKQASPEASSPSPTPSKSKKQTFTSDRYTPSPSGIYNERSSRPTSRKGSVYRETNQQNDERRSSQYESTSSRKGSLYKDTHDTTPPPQTSKSRGGIFEEFMQSRSQHADQSPRRSSRRHTTADLGETSSIYRSVDDLRNDQNKPRKKSSTNNNSSQTNNDDNKSKSSSFSSGIYGKSYVTRTPSYSSYHDHGPNYPLSSSYPSFSTTGVYLPPKRHYSERTTTRKVPSGHTASHSNFRTSPIITRRYSNIKNDAIHGGGTVKSSYSAYISPTIGRRTVNTARVPSYSTGISSGRSYLPSYKTTIHINPPSTGF